MNEEDIVTILKSLQLFQNLSDSELNSISNLFLEKTFQPGETFIEQGDKPDNAYIICQGSARAFRNTEEGEEVNLNVIRAGDLVGEMSLIDGEPRSASVQAIQPTKTLVLKRNDFLQILSDYPDLTVGLLKSLTSRIRHNDEYLEDVLSKNLQERTWKTLQTLAPLFPQNEITLSQEQLSTIIGATRARVTEALNSLQEDQKITLSHRSIKLL